MNIVSLIVLSVIAVTTLMVMLVVSSKIMPSVPVNEVAIPSQVTEILPSVMNLLAVGIFVIAAVIIIGIMVTSPELFGSSEPDTTAGATITSTPRRGDGDIIHERARQERERTFERRDMVNTQDIETRQKRGFFTGSPSKSEKPANRWERLEI